MANPTWTRQRASVKAVYDTRASDLLKAEANCIKSRRTYYSSELDLSSYNSTLPDFDNLQAKYVDEL